jgi:hypothetical protein
VKTKTAYRVKPEIPPDNIPPAEAVVAPEAPTVAVDVQPQPQSVSQTDETAAALQKQIDALRQSEQLQRQQAEHTARLQQQQFQQPATREQKLDAWKNLGMPADEAKFLEDHPIMIDCAALTAVSAREAEAAGHARGSAEFLNAVKSNFDRHLADVQSQQQIEQPAMPQDTPAFFRPAPPQARPRSNGPIVSAPPSREVPSGGPRADETNPRYVHLTSEEKSVAASLGQSEVDYARGKIEVMRRRARGEMQ